MSDSTPPSDKTLAENAEALSVAPLLDAFENFRGSFLDLEREVRISADQLKQLRTGLRRQMQRLGLGPGDRVIAAPPNGPLFAAVWAASLEAGASPILVHSDTPEPELCRMAETWGARFIVAAQPRESPAGPCEVLNADEFGLLRWQRVGDQNSDRFALTSLPLHPTSGTSGGPKIAVRPGPCAVAEPLHYIETLSIDRSDVVLCALPMSHAYAYGMCLLVALLTSADLLFLSRFNPALLKRALARMNISVFPAVPVMLEALLAIDAAEPPSWPRVVLSAGAPLRKETFEACRDQWGLAVQPLYGTTETGGISIGPARDTFDGSVGRPMKGVDVEIAESSGGDFGPDTGVLRVRSASMMCGYLDEGGINREILRDGWFETGDLARIDAKGAIHLQGRLSDVINVLGFKVAPKEVEDVIAMLPEVREVKVYAGRWHGQVVVEAAVVSDARLEEETLLKHCDQHLVSYKCPSAIRFVDSLPRTAAGKVAVERLQGRDRPV